MFFINLPPASAHAAVWRILLPTSRSPAGRDAGHGQPHPDRYRQPGPAGSFGRRGHFHARPCWVCKNDEIYRGGRENDPSPRGYLQGWQGSDAMDDGMVRSFPPPPPCRRPYSTALSILKIIQPPCHSRTWRSAAAEGRTARAQDSSPDDHPSESEELSPTYSAQVCAPGPQHALSPRRARGERIADARAPQTAQAAGGGASWEQQVRTAPRDPNIYEAQ
jgi:hypothetical protein